MDDALLVRGFERVGDLPRNGQRVGERDGPRAMRSRDRSSPSTSSITSAPSSPSSSSRARRSRRCSDGSARRGPRLRAESARADRRRRRRGRQHLDRHLALQLGVAGAIHLPHAACADGAGISYAPTRVPGVSAIRQTPTWARWSTFSNLRGDFIDAKAGAGSKGQRSRDYRGAAMAESRNPKT